MNRLLLGLVALLMMAVPAVAYDPVGKYYATPPAATVEGTDRFILTDAYGRPVLAGASIATPGDALSTVNSTTTPLSNGGVFTGTAVDVGGASSVTVSVLTDQASATNGLSMQQSPDGTNWDLVDTYTVPLMAAGAGKTYGVQIAERYFRVVYTNGGTLQTAFRLQTIVHTVMQATSSQRPSDALSNENDFQQTWSVQSQFNGSTWDRQFTCPLSAVVNVTAAATTQIVALAASQIIRVCSFVITESLAGTAKFVYGTGSNCVTGTTDLTAAMALTTGGGIALSSGGGSLFRTIASNALCLTAVTGNITGFVTYAQY